MMIKTFLADTVAEAIQQVKEEMGADAILLKTRQVSDQHSSHRVEITACRDKYSVRARRSKPSVKRFATPPIQEKKATPTPKKAASPIAPSVGGGSKIVQNDLVELLQRMEKRMLTLEKNTGRAIDSLMQASERQLETWQALQNADVHVDIIRELIAGTDESSETGRNAFAVVEGRLRKLLTENMVSNIEFAPGDRVVFVGPPGVGTTSVMGKLAADLVIQRRKKVQFKSIDSSKVGAFEEIRSYADIFGTTIQTEVLTGTAADSDTITLIDTPSMLATAGTVSALRNDLVRLNPTHCIAVFSVTTRTSDLVSQAERLALLKPSHLVMTMTDLTDRWGGLLTVCGVTGTPLAFVTAAPSGIGELKPPDLAAIVRRLLKTESTESDDE